VHPDVPRMSDSTEYTQTLQLSAQGIPARWK
jgi:hypothetical protein